MKSLLTRWWWTPASWWLHSDSQRSPWGPDPAASCCQWPDQNTWRKPPNLERSLHQRSQTQGQSPLLSPVVGNKCKGNITWMLDTKCKWVDKDRYLPLPPTCMVCSTLLRFMLRLDSVRLRESVRFRVTVTFLVCTVFLYTVLYCKREC